MPSIRLLTTALKVSAIAVVMPSKIAPPRLNTSLTACQALLNVSLNQLVTLPKHPVIAVQTLPKYSPTFSSEKALFRPSQALLNVSLKKLPTAENAFFTASQAPENFSENHSRIPSKVLLMTESIFWKISRILVMPSETAPYRPSMI